ncbi:MAG: hypothetical protein ACRD8U_08330 [Pyrinomonadaceae bacterium]
MMKLLEIKIDVPEADNNSDAAEVARVYVSILNNALVAAGTRSFDDPNQVGKQVLEACWMENND